VLEVVDVGLRGPALPSRAKLAPGTRRPALTDWSPRGTLTAARQ